MAKLVKKEADFLQALNNRAAQGETSSAGTAPGASKMLPLISAHSKQQPLKGKQQVAKRKIAAVATDTFAQEPGSNPTGRWFRANQFLSQSGNLWNVQRLAAHLGVATDALCWEYLLARCQPMNRPARCPCWGEPGHTSITDTAHVVPGHPHGLDMESDQIRQFARPLTSAEHEQMRASPTRDGAKGRARGRGRGRQPVSPSTALVPRGTAKGKAKGRGQQGRGRGRQGHSGWEEDNSMFDDFTCDDQSTVGDASPPHPSSPILPVAPAMIQPTPFTLLTEPLHIADPVGDLTSRETLPRPCLPADKASPNFILPPPLKSLANHLKPAKLVTDVGGLGQCGPNTISFLLGLVNAADVDGPALRAAVAIHALNPANTARVTSVLAPDHTTPLTIGMLISRCFSHWPKEA